MRYAGRLSVVQLPKGTWGDTLMVLIPCCRYEALQLGSVPVYVWDYDIIVPYQELLNWNEVSLAHRNACCEWCASKAAGQRPCKVPSAMHSQHCTLARPASRLSIDVVKTSGCRLRSSCTAKKSS